MRAGPFYAIYNRVQQGEEMTLATEPPNHTDEPLPIVEGPSEKSELVLQELDRILESRFFKNAGRSRQFLEYVVHYQLNGHPDHLKERTIGTAVFQRPPTYTTGDDPVVRVQAGGVRRRLLQYYQEVPEPPAVRIELPVGSYTPHFHWAATEAAANAAADDQPHIQAPAKKRRVALWVMAAASVALAMGAGFLLLNQYRSRRQQSALEDFWAPIFSTQQPVLICLAKGVTYRPNPELYQRYSRAHPGSFQSEVERSNEPLPLDGNEKLQWSQMNLYHDYGVATGDVDAAVKLSSLLGQLHKPSQVRIGENYSFQDLRNSPAVFVGGFNNKWTIRLISTLHFAFVEENGLFTIREQVPGGRTWTTPYGVPERPMEDYAIVARLLDSKTGQFTIITAGIVGSGTQAAGEFATNAEYLETALRGAPPDWQKKNMELVLQTTITDTIPGPPRVVATYYW
jgi:hypothetical protein